MTIEALTIISGLCADGVLDKKEEVVLRKALAGAECDRQTEPEPSENSDFKPDWMNYQQGYMDGMSQALADMATKQSAHGIK